MNNLEALENLPDCPVTIPGDPTIPHKFGRRVWLPTGDEFSAPPMSVDQNGNDISSKTAVKILGYTPARCCLLCHGVFVEKPEEPE